jgi:ribosome-associated translation inhibitor RaiA
MLKEAISEIARIAHEAKAVGSYLRILPELSDKDWTAYIDAAGELSFAEKEKKPWNVGIASLDQISAFVKTFALSAPVITYFETGVRVLANANDRKETTTLLRFSETPAFDWLLQRKNDDTGLTVAQLQSALTWELRDCLTDADRKSLVQHLRKSRWQTVTTSSRDTSVRGRESLGTEVTGSLEGTILELPDEITLSVQPLLDRALKRRSNVRCEIHLLVAAQRIQIIPDARDMQAAVEAAMDEVADLLGEIKPAPHLIYGACD